MSIDHKFNLRYESFHHGDVKNIKSIMFLIHGYGSNAKDLITLAPDMARHIPDMLFISPDGCEEFEGGMEGCRQWYSLIDRSYQSIESGTRTAAEHLNLFINSVAGHFGLGLENIYLLGFSQGCMMSLHLAYRFDYTIRGVIGLSGRLNMEDKLEQEIKSRPKTLLIHGAEDLVVLPEEMDRAANALRKQNVDVSAHLRPKLGHGIDLESVRLIKKFVLDAL